MVSVILNRELTFVAAIMISLIIPVAVLYAASPNLSKVGIVTSTDAGMVLIKTMTKMSLGEIEEYHINFARTFSIEISLENDYGDRNTMNKYKIEVVALNDEGNEIGEKFESAFIAVLSGCYNKCKLSCKSFSLKNENNKVKIYCTNNANTASGKYQKFLLWHCPYSDVFEAEKMIKDAINKYSPQAAYETGMDVNIFKALVKAIIRRESSFRHCTTDGYVQVGPAGSIGLMQINPRYHGEHYDVESNIEKGIEILKNNLKTFNSYKERIPLAVAYYNCGKVKTKVINEVGSNAKNLDWNAFVPVVKKYCSENKGNAVEYVKYVLKYMRYYMGYPDCYRYDCKVII
ncbi:MAG: lytic transglycosylase domain-containing protein [Candidatus Micrarchaeota archaeon]|nr:lytic transglycosylase domain-containing protein [Candidatus Micrarchaeota archaeon]